MYNVVMDLLRHPDLVEVAGDLRSVMDTVLGAEQAAAVVAHRRRRTLRDELIELEDRGSTVVIHTAIGTAAGRPQVAADHVVVDDTVIPLEAILGIGRA
jgi:arginine repressor